MIIPTPYTVGRRRRGAAVEDAHGNLVFTYGDPVDVPVHSISGPTADDTNTSRDGTTIDFVVMAPAGTDFATADLAVVGDVDHNVAKVLDWTKGPWPNPVAGVEIHLTRMEG